MEDKVIINGIEYPNDYEAIHNDIIKDNVSIEYNYNKNSKDHNFCYLIGIILFIVFLVLLFLYFKKKK